MQVLLLLARCCGLEGVRTTLMKCSKLRAICSGGVKGDGFL
jgi:hypothetical protein